MDHFEIERKFLVNHKKLIFLSRFTGTNIIQGYLAADSTKTVRIRVDGIKGSINIKGKPEGIARPEFEYEIPLEDAQRLLEYFCIHRVEKTRYKIEYKGHIWEVDVFHGTNNGLIIAEIELDHIQEKFEIPEWVVQEVTGDEHYHNAFLAYHPFSEWEKEKPG